MILGWIGALVLLLVIVPVVVVLLKGVLDAARDVTVGGRARWSARQRRPRPDLDAVELLATTKTQVNQTVGVVANYGGSLDTILDDA